MAASQSVVQTPSSRHSVLVAGCGSIGTRHVQTLRNLGISRLAMSDPSPARLESAGKRFAADIFADTETAIEAFAPDIVFVCTPPVFHLRCALAAVRSGAHVFVEKPISHTLACLDTLAAEAAASDRVVQVGYNLRFHPAIRKVKTLVEEGAIGKVLWARAEVGQFLPDWRPRHDYRQDYTARRDLGGGIILDASHEIDYLLWILGPPIELACMAGKVSSLEVDVEDCATLLMRFPSGAQADVHMDFVQREYSRSCVFAGENGSVKWDCKTNAVEIARPGKPTEVIAHKSDPGQMYVDEVEDFFYCIDHGKPPQCGIAEASQTLAVALAAKTAAKDKRWVQI